MKYILAIDLGTTCIKVLLIDENGRSIARGQEEVHYDFPSPRVVTQNLTEWYEAICALIRRVLQASAVDTSGVKAIGIASQGISFIPTDETFRPLGMGISWLDSRAEAQIRRVGERWPEETIWSLTGRVPSAQLMLPKLMWLEENEPALFSRTAHFLMPMDYLAARLTGRAATDATMACTTMLCNIHTCSWEKPLLEQANIRPEQLPEILPSGSVVGCLKPDGARTLGLSGDVQVVLGAQDQKSAAFAASLHEGIATLSLGTAGVLTGVVHSPAGRFPAQPQEGMSFSIVPFEAGAYALEGCMDTFGATMRWARDVFMPGESYESMDQAVDMADADCCGVRFDPVLTSRGSFTGITLSVRREHMIRAVYNGLTDMARQYLCVQRAAGARIDSVTAFGGGTRSSTVCQMLADRMQLPVTVTDNPEMAGFGAAIYAARAVGLSFSASEENRRTYTPRASFQS